MTISRGKNRILELMQVRKEIVELDKEAEFIQTIDPRRESYHEQKKLRQVELRLVDLYIRKYHLKHFGKWWD